jgi:hypothetical protein
MIIRSYDAELLLKACRRCPTWDDEAEFDPAAWLENTNNVMLTDGDSVGLATYNRPGVYSVHWFFKVGGRQAINLAREMLGVMFNEHGAEAIRGLTPESIKAARWLAKQVGMKSYGFVEYHDDQPHELMIMTRQEFNGT